MKLFSRRHNSKTIKQRTYIWVRYFLFLLIATLFTTLLSSYFASFPRTREMIKENETLISLIGDIDDDIKVLNKQLEKLNKKNNGTYRVLFGVDETSLAPPDASVRVENENDIGNEKNMFNDRYHNYLASVWRNVNRTKINIVNVSVAFDSISSLASEYVNLSNSIPAAWPIDVEDWTGNMDRFGWRNHPILKRRIFHKGVDLGCPRDSPIYATADGKIHHTRRGWNGGFGTEVMVNHGMGYKTRYAHLNKVLVKRNDIVKRGQLLGYTGSTGRSTGPHLHYEVLYKDTRVNPLNYFRNDLSKEDFSRMLENAKDQSFGDF